MRKFTESFQIRVWNMRVNKRLNKLGTVNYVVTSKGICIRQKMIGSHRHTHNSTHTVTSEARSIPKSKSSPCTQIIILKYHSNTKFSSQTNLYIDKLEKISEVNLIFQFCQWKIFFSLNSSFHTVRLRR